MAKTKSSSIIKPEHIEDRVPFSVHLDKPVADKLARYLQYLQSLSGKRSRKGYVVQEIFVRVLDKDAAFAEWLENKPASAPKAAAQKAS